MHVALAVVQLALYSRRGAEMAEILRNGRAFSALGLSLGLECRAIFVGNPG
jgi:hypothetical protein